VVFGKALGRKNALVNLQLASWLLNVPLAELPIEECTSSFCLRNFSFRPHSYAFPLPDASLHFQLHFLFLAAARNTSHFPIRTRLFIGISESRTSHHCSHCSLAVLVNKLAGHSNHSRGQTHSRHQTFFDLLFLALLIAELILTAILHILVVIPCSLPFLLLLLHCTSCFASRTSVYNGCVLEKNSEQSGDSGRDYNGSTTNTCRT
jgi:hypothetical protein